MKRSTVYARAHRSILFVAAGMYLCLLFNALFLYSVGTTLLSIAECEENNRQTNKHPKEESCWYEDKWWETKFVSEVHVTDVLLAIFTGLLVVVGGWQGHQLRRTVGHMEESAEKQLRAYVMISDGTVTDLRVGNEPKARIIIKNSGQTPAYDLQQWSVMGSGPYPLNGSLPDRDHHVPLPALPLAPNGSLEIIRSLGKLITQHVYDGVVAGEAAIYIVGRISYRDAYGIDRVTNFRLLCSGPDGINDGRTSVTQEGNDAT